MCLLYSLAQAADIVEIVVPYPVGGTSDLLAREISQEITNKSSIKVVVVNKPGADGIVAGEYFLNNQSNKLLISAPSTSLFLKLENPNLPFDPINDFQFIGPMVTTTTMLIVHKNSKIKNLEEFVQLSRKQHLNCGVGNGFAGFVGRYFTNVYMSDITVVPYKSSPAVQADLLGGHIDCVFDTLPPYVGKTDFKVLGMTVPDKTNHYAGPPLFKSDYIFENFFGVAVGKTMDSKLQQQLFSILTNLYKNKEFADNMKDRGFLANNAVSINYSPKLNQDLLFLQRVRQRLAMPKK